MGSHQLRRFHSPAWHYDSQRPIVDGKYTDPQTGDVCAASGPACGGPPSVDILVLSIHAATAGCVIRASRSFTMEAILCHIFRIVATRGLELDSCLATKYTVRLTLAHELTKGEFDQIGREIIFMSEAEEASRESSAIQDTENGMVSSSNTSSTMHPEIEG